MSPEGGVVIFPSGDILTNFSSTVNLICTTLGGPDNMFVWRKEGMIVSNNSVLELTMITGSDGGIYECIVTNDAGYGIENITVFGMCYILLLY